MLHRMDVRMTDLGDGRHTIESVFNPMQTEPVPRATLDAAVRLLTDDDGRILRRVEERLRAWGPPAREALLRAARSDDPRLRSRARALLARTELQDLADEIAARARPRGHVFLLDEALPELHRFVRMPHVRDVIFDRRLDELAGELSRSTNGRTSRTQARHLVELLARRNNLSLATEQLPRERLFPAQVLERGQGTAAGLCALYLVIGRRAGLDLTAVRLGDYFLVRVHGDRRVLVDPTHGGRTVTRADCLRYLRERGERDVGVDRLVDVPDAEVFAALIDDLLLASPGRSCATLREALLRVRARVAADEVFVRQRPTGDSASRP